MKALAVFAVYVGLGALLHALVLGPHLDVSSAWTWAWLLAWPAALLATFWEVGLRIVLTIVVPGALALVWWMLLAAGALAAVAAILGAIVWFGGGRPSAPW